MNKKRSDMSKLFARINATAGFVRVNTTILELGVAFSFTIELISEDFPHDLNIIDNIPAFI